MTPITIHIKSPDNASGCAYRPIFSGSSILLPTLSPPVWLGLTGIFVQSLYALLGSVAPFLHLFALRVRKTGIPSSILSDYGSLTRVSKVTSKSICQGELSAVLPNSLSAPDHRHSLLAVLRLSKRFPSYRPLTPLQFREYDTHASSLAEFPPLKGGV